ncbi:MAG: alpha/beta fold hydrolase [Acidimicrobiales bacterium]
MLRAFADGRIFGVASGGGPARVLALHGWGRTSKDFGAVLDGLDAVALDLPGFGASPPPPEPWGAAEYAAAVAPVVDELAAPVVVLGHSFGGRVAVHLAAGRPELVAGLVLTGAPLVRRPGATARPPALGYRVGRWLHRRGVLGESRMEGLRQRYGSADYRAASGVMRAVHVRAVNETYEAQLAELACPVELVWGDDDAEVPLAVAREVARLVPAAHLEVVPGAGHHTPLTAPGALRDAVSRRLSESGP